MVVLKPWEAGKIMSVLTAVGVLWVRGLRPRTATRLPRSRSAGEQCRREAKPETQPCVCASKHASRSLLKPRDNVDVTSVVLFLIHSQGFLAENVLASDNNFKITCVHQCPVRACQTRQHSDCWDA